MDTTIEIEFEPYLPNFDYTSNHIQTLLDMLDAFAEKEEHKNKKWLSKT